MFLHEYCSNLLLHLLRETVQSVLEMVFGGQELDLPADSLLNELQFLSF